MHVRMCVNHGNQAFDGSKHYASRVQTPCSISWPPDSRWPSTPSDIDLRPSLDFLQDSTHRFKHRFTKYTVYGRDGAASGGDNRSGAA